MMPTPTPLPYATGEEIAAIVGGVAVNVPFLLPGIVIAGAAVVAPLLSAWLLRRLGVFG